MKTFLTFTALLIALTVEAITPFYWSSLNNDGTPNTNTLLMSPYPPSENAFTVIGTNIVFNRTMALVPNASGFISNNAFANTYRVLDTNSNLGFFVVLPDTTSYQSLALYATNVANYQSPLTTYGLVTNLLGFAPAPISYGQNITNGYLAMGLSATNGYMNVGLNATNYALVRGLASTNFSLTLGSNSTNGYLTIGLNATNFVYTIAANGSNNIPSSIGRSTGINGYVVTNGYSLWFSTNMVAGAAPTVSAPNGSFLISSNGTFYVRTNDAWLIK